MISLVVVVVGGVVRHFEFISACLVHQRVSMRRLLELNSAAEETKQSFVINDELVSKWLIHK